MSKQVVPFSRGGNHNPSGKGSLVKKQLSEEEMPLAIKIQEFNLILFKTFQGKAETPDELADRFAQYFQLCIEHKRIPTVEGMAMVSRL